MNSQFSRGVCFLVFGGVLLMPIACSDVKTLTPDDLVTSATLVARYVTPGNGTEPCDDLAPIVDGLFFDYEWRDSKPLFVQMSGSNGNGGEDFLMEVRAVWSDGRRKFGQIDRNRLYLVFRWGDDDVNREPDILAYGTPHPLTGETVPSPTPRARRNQCDVDFTLSNPEFWTRLNPDGQEDQLLVLIKEVDDNFSLAEQTTGLPDLNAEVFRALGSRGIDIDKSMAHATSPMDVWLWRAGRTNDQPVYQRSNWENYESFKHSPFGDRHHLVVDVPEPEFSTFPNFSGFFQDYFIDAFGTLKNDSGRDPKGRVALPLYVQNFEVDEDNPLHSRPIFRTHPDPRVGGRDASQFDGFVLNGSLPVDQAMWDEQKMPFSIAGCDSICPTRGEKSAELWSEKLAQSGLDFDFMFGWSIRTPTGSRKDVRGMGVWNTLTDKIEPTWTVELQREMDSPYDDDLTIQALEKKDGTGLIIQEKKRYLLSLAVADNSGILCSGSNPILLEFEAVDPNQTVFIDGEDKCQP